MPLSKIKILVVEDEAIVARDLTRQLAKLGYEPVGSTPRGEDAIGLVEQLRPDLVLMDIQLAGELDGIAAATEIHARFGSPVVFLTAFADSAVLQRSKEAEPFGYIVKPFDERELYSAIEIGLHKHRTESRLRRSREEFATVLRTAQDGFWSLDREGRILEVNDTYCRLSGYTRDELLGMTVGELVADTTPGQLEQRLATIAADGSARFEHRHRAKGGLVFDVALSATYLPVEGGRFYCFLHDITERRRLDAEREITLRLLHLVNAPSTTRELLQSVAVLLRDWSGCDAVGLRLPEGESVPYYEVRGPAGVLVEKDRQLCNCDAHGQPQRDAAGKPGDHCLCDQLLHGRFDRAKPCFTARGSYWNNTVSDVLAGIPPLPTTHNHGRCVLAESVALVPLRLGSRILGLLQFSDSRAHRFGAARLALLEHLADHLAVAISQRQTQAALQSSEQRFRLLLESTSDYVYTVTRRPDGHVETRHGAGCLKVTGYPPAELLRRPGLWLEMVPAADRGAVETFARQMLAGEQPPPLEHRLTHRDGSVLWVRNSVVVHPPAEDGTLVHDGVITDITGRKRAEESLRASEAKFATVFRSAPLMIAISEIEDGTYLEVNDETMRATGFTREEMIGRRSTELAIMDPADRARLRETLLRDGRIAATPLVVTAKDGRKLDCLFSAEAVEIAGRPRLLSIAHDLTAHKRVEAQLRQVQKMDAFGQLAGGVAHDFNNILAAISLHLGLLREAEGIDPETRASIGDLEKEAARGASLTRQLLAFSRQRTIQMKPLDLREVVENLLKMLRRVIGERIAVDLHSEPELPSVEGDVGMLEQVVMNLCVNARDAMPGGGRIALRLDVVTVGETETRAFPAARPGRFVRLHVSDTGCGMDAATLARIFEPFFTTKDVGRGTGLGLSIVHGIVTQHGGRIEVESTPGRGSTFHVLIPARSVAVAAPVPDAAAPLPLGQGELILAVEDEASVRAILAAVLQRYGYRVLSARNGQEALDAWQARREEIALLLTDMVLPGGMNGIDIIQRLRADRPDLPVIIASGYMGAHEAAAPSDVEKLPKPFEAQLLLEALHRALAPRRDH